MATGSDSVIAGRYHVTGRVGAGGMGTVWLAEDSRLGRRVAIKRVHPERADRMDARFRREMRIGATLSHPNLVTVYDALEEEGGVLLVMEYVEGQSLADALRHGPLEPERGLAVLAASAAGLDHLHEHGVVHRDVKPANILLGLDGMVKLADLGIASSPGMTRITQTGALLGTASYIAPELFHGERATPASDRFAFASVAFEVLSGRRARAGRTPVEIARQAVDEPPPDLAQAWPQAPEAAVKALCRGLAREPAQRFDTNRELVEALREALLGPESEPDSQSDRAPIPGAGMAADAPAQSAAPPAPEPSTAAVFADSSAVPARRPTAPDPATERFRPAARAARPAAGSRGGSSGRRSPRRHRSGRNAGLALAGLAAVAGLAVAAALLLGGEESEQRARATTPADPAPRTATRRPTPAPAGPAQTVTRFYTLAAADRYDEAWALLGPGGRGQLGPFSTFRGTFSDVQRITFSRSEVTSQTGDSASVAFATTSERTSRTDRCTGTAALLRDIGWKIDRLGVSCSG